MIAKNFLSSDFWIFAISFRYFRTINLQLTLKKAEITRLTWNVCFQRAHTNIWVWYIKICILRVSMRIKIQKSFFAAKWNEEFHRWTFLKNVFSPPVSHTSILFFREMRKNRRFVLFPFLVWYVLNALFCTYSFICMYYIIFSILTEASICYCSLVS